MNNSNTNLDYDKGSKLVDWRLRNLNYDRIIDVHKASDHPEVNSFVNEIFDQYLGLNDAPTRTRNAYKKNLKVLLLDLYVAWCNDPAQYIKVHMSENVYGTGAYRIKRYNDLWIKVTLPRVIRILRAVGMTPEEENQCKLNGGHYETGVIGFKRGFDIGEGRISRVWATNKLITMFENARFGEFDIGYSKGRATVILKDNDKNFIDYKSTRETDRMSELVRDYNALLEKSFIDIGDLEIPRIKVGDRKTKKKDDEGNLIYEPVFVNITHQGKFTRRIFNNSSFKKGGRWYGGWWQRLNSKLREDILIDGERTIEIDFSGLHPNLAYTRQGLDYDGDDPYNIYIEAFEELGINHTDASREVIKLMMLLGLNATDEEILFKAFRDNFNYSFLGAFDFSFTNKQLSKILQSIKDHHSPIADQFATGAGIDLMYMDSQIVEEIINLFTVQEEPILTVHDSFIVKFWQKDLLLACMKEAFQSITDRSKVKLKQTHHILTREQVTASKHLDRDYYLDYINDAVPETPKTCRGYLNRLNRHNKHYANKDVQQDRPMFVPDWTMVY